MRIALVGLVFLGCSSPDQVPARIVADDDSALDVARSDSSSETTTDSGTSFDAVDSVSPGSDTAAETYTPDTGAAEVPPPVDAAPTGWKIASFPKGSHTLRSTPDKFLEVFPLTAGTYKSVDLDITGHSFPFGGACTYALRAQFLAGDLAQVDFPIYDTAKEPSGGGAVQHVLVHKDFSPPITFTGTTIDVTFSAPYTPPSGGCTGSALFPGESSITFNK